MLIHTIALALLVTQSPAPSAAELESVALEQRVRSVVEPYHEAGEFQGLTLVARGGEVVRCYAVGSANRA